MLQAIGKHLTVEVLHHEEVDVAVAPDVVQRADVGVVEVGDRASLAFETFAMARIAGEVMTYDFDRYGAVEARVDRFPYHAHPSLADLLDQAVVLELLAGFESYGRAPHNVCVLEGKWHGSRTVVLEFDSVDAARAWYNSAGYQAIVDERHRAAETNVAIVGGFVMPGN